jgi:hypothetical protein
MEMAGFHQRQYYAKTAFMSMGYYPTMAQAGGISRSEKTRTRAGLKSTTPHQF